MQKQMQKQSWQINNLQNQLIKHAKTSAPHGKATVASKMPENSKKEEATKQQLWLLARGRRRPSIPLGRG
ncbi:hypothetical protein LMH87_006202 [Akanthomyces muscarius]|nr:hypothetical protein LMH87_006202 [Akanthomyces muscarius]KAJ4164530.1 hypothetical protein LMH87_006202 [Akanthomyces muscarius]